MKRILSFLLALTLVIACSPVISLQASAATVARGICGENLTWTLDSVGTLTISGTGAMAEYDATTRPWNVYEQQIKRVVIEKGVTSISGYLCYGCTNLTSVMIPYGVSSIGWAAFYGCSSLVNIGIPDCVTSIGGSAFGRCDSLTSMVIPDGVSSIGEYMFTDCYSLTSITIPDSVTSIGEYAFYGCKALADVYYTGTESQWSAITIDASNQLLTDAIVYYDAEKTNENFLLFALNNDGESYYVKSCSQGINGELTIPAVYNDKPVTAIGMEAFLFCTGLTSVTVPGSVAYIDCNAFNECTNLTSIVFSEGVTTIGRDLFNGCTNLTSISIPNSVIYIDSTIYGLPQLTYNMYNGAKYIGNEENPYLVLIEGTKESGISESTRFIHSCAFCGIEELTEIVIPNSVTLIGEFAFADCTNLSSVAISGGTTYIEPSVFEGCSSLTDVYYSGTEEQRNILVINYGNDSLTSASWHYTDIAALHKQDNAETYYKTLEEALAVTDGTIQLLADVTADVVNLNANVTLDLNGYTLTADSVSGKVMDSQDGEGLIKVSAQGAVLSSNDDQLILWDNATGNAGYRVFNYTFTNMGLDAHGDDESESAKYGATVKSVWSDLVFTNSYAYTLAASTYSGLQVGFELSWTPDGGETTSKTFNFNAATVGAWGTAEEGNTGAENYCFYIRVTGFEELLASGMVTVKPVVSTAFNAAETAVTEMRYEYTEPNAGGLEYEVGFGVVPQM